MAGGKQTPRQKLVGMMYLVLTALLALQVSSAVLDKFILIARSFEIAIAHQLVENEELVHRVTKTVKDNGNKQSEVELLKKISIIRKHTDEVIQKIRDLKLTLIKKAGGTPKKIVGLRNDAVVGNIMINNNKGEELKKLLNNYVDFLNRMTGKSYSPIALDARDIDFLKNDPNQGRKSFVMLNFKKSPLAAAIATLSQFISEVVYKESDALTQLARGLGAEDYKVDTIKPFVIPESSIVASGDKYRAQVVLSAYSSSKPMDIKVNGKAVTVKEGIGYIELPAKNSPNYRGSAPEKKSFEVSVALKNKAGKTDTQVIKENYLVTKPVILVESDSVNALYFNCSNDLNIRVPAYGTAFNPTFKVDGASMRDNGGGKVSIVPTDTSVKLSVYQNKAYVDFVKFSVRKVPFPLVQLFSQGKIVDESKDLPAPGPRSLQLKIVPDASFKQFLPKEARYKISKAKVMLGRRGTPVVEVPIRSSKLDMSKITSQARPGDKIVIEIEEIHRITSRNTLEKVEMGTVYKSILLK